MNVTFTDDHYASRGHFHSIPEYSSDEKKHCWVVIMAYQVNPAEALMVLTKDSLVSLQKPFCYYCERDYDELIVRRDCEGLKLEKI